MTNPVWLGIGDRTLPVGGGLPGPPQESERLAKFQQALVDARLEYALARLHAVEKSLGVMIPALRNLPGSAYALLLASSLVLAGRTKWRRTQRQDIYSMQYLEQGLQSDENRAFAEAASLFAANEAAIAAQQGSSRLYTDYGIALHRIGHHDEALAVFEQAFKTGAAPAEAFGYAGMAHVARNEFEAAIEALNKGLQLAPGDRILEAALAVTLETAGPEHYPAAVQAFCQTAIAAGKENDIPAAREALRRALRLCPHDPQALSMYVLLLQSQGESAAALASVEQALQSDAKDPWALGLQGMLLRESGRLAEAIAVLQKVEVKSSDLAWVLLQQALAVASSDITAARRLVSRAARFLGEDDLQVDGTKMQIEVQAALAGLQPIGEIATGLIQKAAGAVNLPIVRFIGQMISPLFTALKKTSPEQVTAMLKSVVKLWPDSIEALQALADLLLQQNELGEAGEVLDKALARAPDSAPLLSLKAQLLRDKNQMPEAVRLYRQAARLAPEDDGIFFSFIAALIDTARYDDAIYELDRKLAAAPGHGLAIARKAALLNELGRFAEALAILQTAEREVDSQGGAALFSIRVNLGCAFRGLDRFEEAAAAFDRAIPLEQQPLYDARAFRITLHMDVAEYQQAAELAAATIALFPQSEEPAIRMRLGWLHGYRGWALHHIEGVPLAEVAAQFRTAVALLPEDPYAQIWLAEVLLRQNDSVAQGEGEKILIDLTESSASRQIPLGVIGWCHYLLRRYEAAEHWLRAALPPGGGATNPALLDQAIATRFDLALVLLAAARPVDAAVEYETARTLAQNRPELRRRGLLHVAASDLLDAMEAAIIPRDTGNRELAALRTQLAEANYPIAQLADHAYA